MQTFENFITAGKSRGEEDPNGKIAELGILTANYMFPAFLSRAPQVKQPIQTRAALTFLLSEKRNFFQKFVLDEIVKGIDAVTREQIVRIMAVLGIGNVTPVFSMVPCLGPIRPAGLLPTITEEDKVILNNVQKVVEFLTAGSSTSSSQGVNVPRVIQEVLPVLPGLSATVLPEVLHRLFSRVMARLIRNTFL